MRRHARISGRRFTMVHTLSNACGRRTTPGVSVVTYNSDIRAKLGSSSPFSQRVVCFY